MRFEKWLDTFIEEKGIDLEESFELEGQMGTNFFTYGVIIEHMKITSKDEQNTIKNMLVKIDFMNGDIKHFLRHLAKALVY